MEGCFLIISFFFAIILFRWLKPVSSRTLPLPPGPTRYPVIGNLLQAPVIAPWETFHEWSKILGEVLYIKLPFQQIVVLDSIQASLDLLEKRSDIYSDRPRTVMNALMFIDRWCLPLIGYSPLWRSYRRNFHQFFNQREVHKYRHTQLRGCRVFLQRILDNPSELNQQINLLLSSLVLKLVYNMNVTDVDDEYLKLASEGVQKITDAALPGKFWVEFAPIFRHVPGWIPGASFKRYVKDVNPKIDELLGRPFEAVKRDWAAGNAGPCITTTLINKLHENDGGNLYEKEGDIRNIVGVSYAAGVDTTTAAVQSFFIAMSLYPNVQAKAQRELDRIVGPDRLPTFDDYDSLIYTQAVVLETLRWLPVSPLGLPHCVTRDDEYKGMHIPKGSIVMPNIWAILHDPNEYPDPYCFNPDRFIKNECLDPDVRNPMATSFGFGRRICPGRWLSHGSIFMTAASTLHTMNIHPILGSDNETFDPFDHTNVYSGIKLAIHDLPCTVKPRSAKIGSLVRESILSSPE